MCQVIGYTILDVNRSLRQCDTPMTEEQKAALKQLARHATTDSAGMPMKKEEPRRRSELKTTLSGYVRVPDLGLACVRCREETGTNYRGFQVSNVQSWPHQPLLQVWTYWPRPYNPELQAPM